MENRLYKKRYAAWAGYPSGNAPDYAKCCIEVFPSGRGALHHQCNKDRGFGPDKAYCKTHDPEVVAAREAASTKRYHDKHNKERYSWHGPMFYRILKQIAEGHNDAQNLARETLAEFHKGER